MSDTGRELAPDHLDAESAGALPDADITRSI